MAFSETNFPMGASAGKPPAAPDPNVIIPLESQYNRFNSSGPFGSQTWSSGGPGGHETLNTTLDPRMSAAVDRAFNAAATPYQKEYIPTGMDQLTSAVLGRVGSKYGLSGNALDTNLQHQKPQSQSPMPPQGMPAMGAGMPNLSYNAPGAPGPAQQMGAIAPGQAAGLIGQMGMPQMGFNNPGNLMGAMNQMRGG